MTFQLRWGCQRWQPSSPALLNNEHQRWKVHPWKCPVWKVSKGRLGLGRGTPSYSEESISSDSPSEATKKYILYFGWQEISRRSTDTEHFKMAKSQLQLDQFGKFLLQVVEQQMGFVWLLYFWLVAMEQWWSRGRVCRKRMRQRHFPCSNSHARLQCDIGKYSWLLLLSPALP